MPENYQMEQESCLFVQVAFWVLVILAVVAVVSPTLTILVEAVLYALMISSRQLRHRFVASLRQPIVIGALLLLAILLLSSLWGVASWEDKLDKMLNWRKLLLIPIAISLVQTPLLKNRFLFAFVFAVGAFAILSWLLYIAGLFNILDVNVWTKPNDVLRNHITQGMVFFVGTFTIICLLLNQKNFNRYLKIGLIVLLVLILANCFVVSTSRTGYLVGLVLACCLGIYIKNKWALVVFPIVVAVLLYASPTTNQQIRTIFNDFTTIEQETSGGARMLFISNAIPMALSAPLFGHGLRSFKTEYAKQVKDLDGWRGEATHDPHNQYLLIMVEQGIVGLLVFFIFIATCFMQKTDWHYRVLALSVLLGWLASSMFNGHFASSVEGRFIMIWLGVLLAMPLKKTPSD